LKLNPSLCADENIEAWNPENRKLDPKKIGKNMHLEALRKRIGSGLKKSEIVLFDDTRENIDLVCLFYFIYKIQTSIFVPFNIFKFYDLIFLLTFEFFHYLFRIFHFNFILLYFKQLLSHTGEEGRVLGAVCGACQGGR
jgi:hypothetical protein